MQFSLQSMRTRGHVPVAGQGLVCLEQRYRRASVMVGVLPVGRLPGGTCQQAAFFWSLRADRLHAWRATGLDAWKAEVSELWSATQPILEMILLYLLQVSEVHPTLH